MERKQQAFLQNGGKDAAKISSKRVVQKTSEATDDLIGNKIADKITLVGKTRNKERRKTNEW